RRTSLFGWAQQFHVERAGGATLSFSTPMTSRLLQAVQVLALGALALLAGRRRRLASARPRRTIRRGAPVVVVESTEVAPTEVAPTEAASAEVEPTEAASAEAPSSEVASADEEGRS
ncbi:MAG TPA: hypothetical protein PLS63_12115, partial [Microthrixaceae bacterium]|nr:hypothetical protein [Microthrixaceae bacterium]